MSSRLLLATLVLVMAALTAWVVSSLVSRDGARATRRDDARALADARGDELPEVAAASAQVSSHDETVRRASAPTSLTGRVIGVDDERGLAGFWIRSWNDSELAGDTSSDANGYFQLPAPNVGDDGHCECRVRAQAPYGWTVAPRELKAISRADGGFDELLFRARPARSGKLSAKLVDLETGEPVPEYMLRLATGDGSREQIVTDANGAFTSEREYFEGAIRLMFHDFETSAQGSNEERLCYLTEIEFDPRAEPVKIAIPVGPTYRLELNAPADVLRQILFAELRPARADEPARVVRAEAQVREGAPRWIRFRPMPWRSEPLVAPWNLAIASTDGLWFGEAPIQSMRGIQPTLAITLEARSQLLGRLRDREGQSIGQASVSLSALGERDFDASTLSSGNGLFAFELVPAGRYLITAISAQHAIASREVLVGAGERTEVELVLDKPVIAGVIAGRLVAKTRREARSPTVVLLSCNPYGRRIEQPTQWTDGDELATASFRFDDVPAGDYELVLSNYSALQWTPARLHVTPPAEGLEFSATDAHVCVAFEVTDASSDRPLDVYRALVLSRGSRAFTEELERAWGDCIFHAGELDSDARWIVGAAGYAPRWGTRDELEPAENGLVARASLERGWGVELAVIGPGFAPLANAEVFLDDELAATTERDGVVRLVRERAPSRIDVRRGDWRVDPTSRGTLRRTMRDVQLRIEVSMSPP